MSSAGLPSSAQEIADIIGRARALYLIGMLPTSGSRPWRRVLYVPKRMPQDHWLIQCLGHDDAERMRRHFGGAILQPANCGFVVRDFRNREIARMRADGKALDEIAEAVGLSTYRVREILRYPAEGNPPEEKSTVAGQTETTKVVKGRQVAV